MKKVDILGVGVSITDYEKCVQTIIQYAKERKSLSVTAQPVHGFMEAHLHPSFKKTLNNFDIVTPDGMPVKIAANILGKAKLKDRVYGPSLMLKTCKEAEKNKMKIYLYGSTPEVLEKLEKSLNSKFPKLIIAGKNASKFGDLTEEENEQDLDKIKKSKTKIVFVGLGCPKQEKWVYKNSKNLKMPLIAVGAAFDFISGNKKQAPSWMQKISLEWLFRLIQEPRRLWKRYLVYNPLFILLLSLQFIGLKKFR